VIRFTTLLFITASIKIVNQLTITESEETHVQLSNSAQQEEHNMYNMIMYKLVPCIFKVTIYSNDKNGN
jgi:hypothetical protein